MNYLIKMQIDFAFKNHCFQKYKFSDYVSPIWRWDKIRLQDAKKSSTHPFSTIFLSSFEVKHCEFSFQVSILVRHSPFFLSLAIKSKHFHVQRFFKIFRFLYHHLIIKCVFMCQYKKSVFLVA